MLFIGKNTPITVFFYWKNSRYLVALKELKK